ncbi:ABC transporter ATP-binding protein [Pueribacillus sp. YX66]|uniref:ABC transporter ATP-binding protein n=1 Tax=Pueribacillus sp. YX66 TaxID=3229242 RepID=UPI00358D18B3
MESILKSDSLYFSYHSNPIINGVDFAIKKGEICSIIGPNGAGKTTFLNLLSGMLIPNAGDVFYKNKKITKVQPNKRRELGISRSFQITNIFMQHTVYENIRYAVQGVNKQKYQLFKSIDSMTDISVQTEKLLEICHLTSVKDEKCSDLAYAEQRLVEIALSLAGNTEVLLLDEPTAGLSMEESRYIADFIKQLSRDLQLSIVFIEHDMDIVFDISNRISVLYYGELLLTDTPEHVKENKQVQEIYLGEELA